MSASRRNIYHPQIPLPSPPLPYIIIPELLPFLITASRKYHQLGHLVQDTGSCFSVSILWGMMGRWIAWMQNFPVRRLLFTNEEPLYSWDWLKEMTLKEISRKYL